MTLEYDETSRCHRKLILNSGRGIWLDSLHQQMTYSGLLVGFPDKEFNDEQINRHLEHATDNFTHGLRSHLITPPRRDYEGEPADLGEFLPARINPEFLPAVCCMACFFGLTTPRNPDMHLSFLTVVWYQDDFAMPIDASVLVQLRSLDWDSIANDVEL